MIPTSTSSASVFGMAQAKTKDQEWRELERKDGETLAAFQVRVNLVRFRNEHGLPQEEAALRAGISTSQLSKMESGARGISNDMQETFATLYRHAVAHLHLADPPAAEGPIERWSGAQVRAAFKRNFRQDVSDEDSEAIAKILNRQSVARAHETHKARQDHKRKRRQ